MTDTIPQFKASIRGKTKDMNRTLHGLNIGPGKSMDLKAVPDQTQYQSHEPDYLHG